jgi:hypothetical protein
MIPSQCLFALLLNLLRRGGKAFGSEKGKALGSEYYYE